MSVNDINNTQAKRLQFILSELHITPYRFSKILGYKRPDSIYHILSGHQKISTKMQRRINETKYEINVNWLISGKGVPFQKQVKTINEKDLNILIKILSYFKCGLDDVEVSSNERQPMQDEIDYILPKLKTEYNNEK